MSHGAHERSLLCLLEQSGRSAPHACGVWLHMLAVSGALNVWGPLLKRTAVDVISLFFWGAHA